MIDKNICVRYMEKYVHVYLFQKYALVFSFTIFNL